MQYWTGFVGELLAGAGVAGPDLFLPCPPFTKLPRAWRMMRVRWPPRLPLSPRSLQKMHYI